MKNRLLLFCLISGGLLLVNSCEKENVELLSTTEEEFLTDTVICEITANISLTDSATLVVFTAGGLSPYSYLWSQGATTSMITPTIDGTYSVTVTDGEGCFTATTYEYSATDLCVLFTIQAIHYDSSGQNYLSVSTTGGLAPYSYNWSEGSATQLIGPVSNGTFGITVVDSQGCVREDEITI
ncbi:MAG: hypothetical protein ACRBG0_07775 [Lewinella sp.]|uniref:hypothetical protein n=1 Tax=Lewinella sp. TaxID=2004506 RepID=UPI003D6B83FD